MSGDIQANVGLEFFHQSFFRESGILMVPGKGGDGSEVEMGVGDIKWESSHDD